MKTKAKSKRVYCETCGRVTMHSARSTGSGIILCGRDAGTVERFYLCRQCKNENAVAVR